MLVRLCDLQPIPDNLKSILAVTNIIYIGHCVLVRLCDLQRIPDDLKSILAEPNIIKVKFKNIKLVLYFKLEISPRASIGNVSTFGYCC